MKKFSKILFLPFLLASSLLTAQVKPDSLQNKVNKWSIGILGGSTFTYSYIKDYYTNSNPWTYDERINHDIGISFGRIFNKNTITLGTFYNSLGYRENDKYIATQKNIYFFRVLSFPILYEREIGKWKSKFEIGTGIVASRCFFSSYSGNPNFYEECRGSNQFMLSGSINAGIKYDFYNMAHVLLRVEYNKNFIGANLVPYYGPDKLDYFTINLGVFRDF